MTWPGALRLLRGARVDAIDVGFRRSLRLPGGVCDAPLGRRIQAAGGVRGFAITFRWASRRHRHAAIRARCGRKRACQSDDSGAVAGKSSTPTKLGALSGAGCLHHMRQSIEPDAAERHPVGRIRKGSTWCGRSDPIRQQGSPGSERRPWLGSGRPNLSERNFRGRIIASRDPGRGRVASAARRHARIGCGIRERYDREVILGAA
jgi:hypothetical protein